jgi:hypothetical protein
MRVENPTNNRSGVRPTTNINLYSSVSWLWWFLVTSLNVVHFSYFVSPTMQSIKQIILACLLFLSSLAQIVSCDEYQEAPEPTQQAAPVHRLSPRLDRRFTNSSTPISSSTFITSSSVVLSSSTSSTLSTSTTIPNRPPTSSPPTSSNGAGPQQDGRPPFGPPNMPTHHDSPFHMSTAETIGLWVGVGCICAIIAAGLIFFPRIRSAWRTRRLRRAHVSKMSEDSHF